MSCHPERSAGAAGAESKDLLFACSGKKRVAVILSEAFSNP